mmetsp:Transcript_91610/g.261846  ORF Transcript_91610/g.261846 Transcript_91610/m.261846 type:complete len:302 (-) Transcript_91610:244-1149(-)
MVLTMYASWVTGSPGGDTTLGLWAPLPAFTCLTWLLCQNKIVSPLALVSIVLRCRWLEHIPRGAACREGHFVGEMDLEALRFRKLFHCPPDAAIGCPAVTAHGPEKIVPRHQTTRLEFGPVVGNISLDPIVIVIPVDIDERKGFVPEFFSGDLGAHPVLVHFAPVFGACELGDDLAVRGQGGIETDHCYLVRLSTVLARSIVAPWVYLMVCCTAFPATQHHRAETAFSHANLHSFSTDATGSEEPRKVCARLDALLTIRILLEGLPWVGRHQFAPLLRNARLVNRGWSTDSLMAVLQTEQR